MTNPLQSANRLKRSLRVLLLLLTAGHWTSAESAFAQESYRELRVLTYNIHHGAGADEVVDLEHQATVIRELNPDLVALQEVDDRTQRTGKVDQATELGRLTGMHVRFAHQLDFEGGRYGQAILSRFPCSELTVHWLPGVPDRERRIAGSVTVDLDGEKLTFVTTHLHHNNTPLREGQAERLSQLFGDEHSAPVIVAGDLNATPDSRAIAILKERFEAPTGTQELLTYPAGKPERQLDYILFQPRDRFTVVSIEVPPEAEASDHRPVLSVLRLHRQQTGSLND
jgi:endonuclease/exonuclease/phosphatase family metal-dependent hydrolase